MISTIYDNLITLVKTALPTYEHMSFSGSYLDNSDLIKLKGFSIKVNGSINSERKLSCHESVVRNFEINLYNKAIYRRQNEGDLSGIYKTFLTDVDTLIKSIGNNATLDDSCVSFKYITDNGITLDEDDTINSMRITIAVSAEYFL